jgi:hypothetical protein
MAGLVPAIHVLLAATKDVDARHKAGHDESEWRQKMDANGTGFAKTCAGAAECEGDIMMYFCGVPKSQSVVPAKAGTHNPRLLLPFRIDAPALHREFPAYGSLLSQGRRSECA